MERDASGIFVKEAMVSEKTNIRKAETTRKASVEISDVDNMAFSSSLSRAPATKELIAIGMPAVATEKNNM